LTVRDDLLAKLGPDPLANGRQTHAIDLQGWNSVHPYLTEAIDRHRPGVVVEVGVWKGASACTMARRIRELGCDGAVIAVDTWRGSAEHWPPASDLYDRFLSNVVAERLRDYIVPLPLDSASAANLLAMHEIQADVIHIDGAHDYLSVITDLHRWWGVLATGGTMIVDDYASPMWTSVTRAVDEFRCVMRPDGFETFQTKCRFVRV
jgi:predicted O-methyltransferase YrrM